LVRVVVAALVVGTEVFTDWAVAVVVVVWCLNRRSAADALAAVGIPAAVSDGLAVLEV
jgi:hypothetical protein